jgi:hypothetical protein
MKASIIVIAIALESCGPEPVAMTGSGTILYWHTELVALGQCGGADLVAALTPSGMKLELLRYSPPAIRVEGISFPSPTCTPSPVQMAAVDIDGDGVMDLAVSDSGDCGNWYALLDASCQFTAHAWSDSFPPIGAMPWMSSWKDPSIPRERFLLASYGGITVMERSAAGVPWQLLGPSPALSDVNVGQTEVSDIGVFLTDPLSGKDAVLFQEGGSGALVTMATLAPTGTTLDPPTSFPQQNVQDLQPFEAIDQLKVLTDPVCGQYGLGFGIFSSEDGTIPHRLQLVSPIATGYQTAELDKRNGRALAVTEDAGGVELVALLTDDDVGSGRTLSLNSITGCVTFGMQASTQFPLPDDVGPIRNDGLVFVQRMSGSVPDLISYNGSRAAVCTSSASSVTCTAVTPETM